MNEILFLAIFFLATFLFGRLLEKIRIPWIFASLLIGFILAIYNPFREVTASASFDFLAELGMYFLLFIIGFELDVRRIFSQSRFIFSATATIISIETVLGSLVVHYIFGMDWFASALVATSFATVGEAVLLPILDEFKLVKTKLGQTLLSIGVLDDLVEVVVILIASVMISHSAGHVQLNIIGNLIILATLFLLVFVMHKLHSKIAAFKFSDIHSLFLFVLFFIFLFIGIGKFVDAAALGAILAGIALRNIIPKERLDFIDSEIRTLSYGLFAPIFFLSVGVSIDVFGLMSASWKVLIVVVVTAFAKILGIFLSARSRFNTRKLIMIATGLMVKLSTSIVVVKLLLQNNIISLELYSVLVAATVIFTLIVPFVLSLMISVWKPRLTKVSGDGI